MGKHKDSCSCKTCVTKCRKITCVKDETKRHKYNIGIRSDQCTVRTDADTGTWNAKVIYPAGSAFVNSPNNIGRYNIVDGVVHATSSFATDGPGRLVKTDLANAIVALPVPASRKGPFNGTIIHVYAVQDGGKTTIAVGRIEYQSDTVARIRSSDLALATNEDQVPNVRPCYAVYVKLTYQVSECYNYTNYTNCKNTCC
jgi:hypothetical protein